jgi:hypothetical protein
LKTDKSNIMKRRLRKIANFFAFNLLFFALYLNFIHKDKLSMPIQATPPQHTAAFSGTMQTEDAAKKTIVDLTVQETETPKPETGAPLKLSIN